MGRIRNITFGYRLANGTVLINEQEAETVRAVFANYLAGLPLSQIAALCSESLVPYSETASAWNKNMVKRIIDCEKYTGTGVYPTIIDKQDFTAANQSKAERYKGKYTPHKKKESPIASAEPHTYKQTLEVTRLQNEVKRQFESRAPDREHIKLLIFKCATAKYAALSAKRSDK